jgi:membrane protein implicated in regulation of membrane protease activity
MKLFAVAAALSAAAASPAFAHHGWSGQEDKITSLTGTVVQSVNLAGPHGGMKIKVGNQVWDITLAPPFRTSGSGLTEGKIPVGSTVTVRGNKTTEPGHYEMKTIYVKHGKDEYRVYPERDR